jgi:hypothetical protein
MARVYIQIEELKKRAGEGDPEARATLSYLGKIGGRRSGEVRRAKKFAEIEIKEELELIELDRRLASAEEKRRQANEHICFVD